MTSDYIAMERTPEDVLMHYGVLGMKWGIRRYQNPDGTLTALGKKHLDDGKTQAAIDKWNQKKNTAIAKGNKKFVEKNLDYLSNEDINRFNERLRARNSINDLKQKARTIDAEKVKTWMNTASNITMNAAQIGENGVKLYNTVAKLHNAFDKSGNKWKIVGEQEEKPKPEAISRFFDENGKLTKSVRTWTNEDGNKVTDSREYKKDDKSDSSGASSGPKETPPTSPSSGGGEKSNAQSYKDAWDSYAKNAKENFAKSRENAYKNAYKNEPEKVEGEVVNDGTSRRQHTSTKRDTSTVDAEWKDVTPSAALTVYMSYKALPAPSSSGSSSSSSGSTQSSANSSKSSGSSSSSSNKSSWTSEKVNNYQDLDDYTKSLYNSNEETIRKWRDGK